MVKYALAADVGGTWTRVALVDAVGGVSCRHSHETMAHEGRDAVMRRLADVLEQVAVSQRTGIVGVGLSVASPIDPETGEMYNPPNLGEEWHMYTPKPFLQKRLSLPVWAANDATLGALGEHAFGAGKGCRSMVYMTVSTGIGGGIVIDGNLYTGASGFGGEIGHMTIDRNGPLCNCGNVGCLEALASGGALARIAQERVACGEGSALIEFAGGDISRVDARVVAEAALSGDALAMSLMHDVALNLASGIINLMHIFDPQIIVIGGGVAQNLDMLMPTIEAEVKRRAMAQFRGAAPVAKSQLGDDVSLLGAAALAFANAKEWS